MKPPYLILHKQSRILNTPNSVARVFDDIGSKCKMMYHFKISAFAGMTEKGFFRLFRVQQQVGFLFLMLILSLRSLRALR